MSRVGKLPILVPDGINIALNGKTICISSNAISKHYNISNAVNISLDKQLITLTENSSISRSSMFLGMDRMNIKNIIDGLSKEFKVLLEVNGVGYKVNIEKNFLIMSLGYSHDIYYQIPNGVNISFEKPNIIIIKGDDKILCGQVASEIISFRKTEPYKGKGIKIFGKKILRKEGKKK